MSIIVLTEEQKELKSPLESIKGIKANITMDEILEAINQPRRRATRYGWF